MKLIKYIIVILLLIVCIPNVYADKTLSYITSASTDDNGAKLFQADPYPFMWMPFSNNTRSAFTRWPVHIPPNATIVSASVTFTVASNSYTGTAHPVSIDLVNLADCPSVSSNTSTLPLLGSPVTDTFSGTWSAGNAVTTPDLKSLIDAYVAIEGYQTGRYIGFKYYNPGSTTSSSVGCYNSGQPAILNIIYSGGDVTIDNWMAEPHSRTTTKMREMWFMYHWMIP